MSLITACSAHSVILKGGRKCPLETQQCSSRSSKHSAIWLRIPQQHTHGWKITSKTHSSSNAGNVHDVARHAEKLRLAVTDDECGLVLDHLAQTGAINITIDHVEDAINSLFDDRFIEP